MRDFEPADTPAQAWEAEARYRARFWTDIFSGISFSGDERDHLFVLDKGRYHELSGLTGIDDPADGRSFAYFDFDRDGWLDIAAQNFLAPVIRLYRNRIGETTPERTNRFIALRLIGGNHGSTAAKGWSNRDGIGARVTIDLGERRVIRQHTAGGGFLAQNSAVMLVGLGEREQATVTIRWPSGKQQALGAIRAGQLVSVFENAADAPGGKPIRSESYRRTASRLAPAPAAQPVDVRLARARANRADLTIYTTVATWCESCQHEIPELQELIAGLPGTDVHVYGVPVEPQDTEQKLDEWMKQNRPPYELLDRTRDAKEIAAVVDLVKKRLRLQSVPATIVVDRQGHVVIARWGAPTVSEARRVLAAARASARR